MAGSWPPARKAAAAVQTAAGGTPKGVKDHPLAMQINDTIKKNKGANFAGSKERILPFLQQTNQEPLSGSRTATPLPGINPPGSNQNKNS